MSREILFSGKELVVHYTEGYSDYLLITFIGAYHEGSALDGFFLQNFALQKQVTCIGITTHRRSYYISPEIEQVFEIVRPFRERFAKVVVVGQSMGGYAAIKYSSRLGADCVLTFAPGFSIDPDELETPDGVDPRHIRRILRHAVAAYGIDDSISYKGMAVRPADCSGLIVTVFDPKEIIDGYNSLMLKRQDPDLQEIRISDFGHATATLLESNQAIETVITALLSGDVATVRTAFRSSVRGSPQVRLTMLRKLAARKPELCVRVLGSRHLDSTAMRRSIRENAIEERVVFQLIARGRSRRAAETLSLLYGLSPPLLADENDRPDAAPIGDGRCGVLLSCHGSFLGYDIGKRAVVLARDVFSEKTVVPVIATNESGRAGLHVVVGAGRLPVSIAQSAVGDGSEPGAGVGVGTEMSFERSRGALIAIRIGAHYVRARDGGELDTGATRIDAWEEFAVVSAASDHPVLARSYINWFDQTLLTGVVRPSPSPQAAAAEKRPGWIRRLTGRR